MKRFFLLSIMLLPLLAVPAEAKPIRWVDFNIPYESLKYAMEQDIATFEEEQHLSWIDVLALAACREDDMHTDPLSMRLPIARTTSGAAAHIGIVTK